MHMKLRQLIFLVLILLIFGAFLGWPIVQIVRVGFQGIHVDGKPAPFTLDYLVAVFKDESLRQGLWNSVFIAVLTTFACLVISIPLALLSVRYEFRGKDILGTLLLMPLILPPFVGAIGLRQILGRFGALTSITQDIGIIPHGHAIDWMGVTRLGGIVVVEALSLYPILFLNICAALANLDPAMEQAAANLGADRWTIFRRITLPLMRPGLFAGGTIVLIWSFTELGTPLMFDYYEVTPVQVFHRLTQVAGNPLPYALVVVMLVAQHAALHRRPADPRPAPRCERDQGVDSVERKKARWLRRIGAAILRFIVIIALAMLPHVGVILTSVSGVGQWYQIRRAAGLYAGSLQDEPEP